MRRAIVVFGIAATLLSRATLAASAAAASATSGAAPADTASHAPAENRYSYAYDMFDNSFVRPATRMFDVARLARRVTGHPREAANVDEHDQVRQPSTWWQPRVGFRPVTVEQMLKGPGSGTGPAPGRWTVSKGKDQGVTPGFQVKDAAGAKFLIKFDPPGYPELANQTAVIGSRLLWAAGYNVTDEAVTSFQLENLDVAKDATYTDAHGKKQPFTKAYLERVLSTLDRRPDGSYACLASRYLDGKPLGPYEYNGRRRDDPEDLIPHELHRELRGFWTICAWLNHADSRGPNSLDMWVTENGRSFVRHYLLDYNAILGSGDIRQHAYQTGLEYYFDVGTMSHSFARLGLAPAPWERSVDPHMPAVGFVDSKVFSPGGWRPDYPNPAFDDRTERDIRWGARIVAGFTDEHIRAAVAAAHYTDPRAAEYVARILIERRDKIVARWLGPHAPEARLAVSP
jgi:hypothetical protein